MKAAVTTVVEEESAMLTIGGTSAVFVAFLQEAVLRMIPYSIPAIMLLVLDLFYGCRAARFRKEKVRISTAVRRSVTKLASYTCWLILASTIAIAFHKDWLEWAVLGLVYLNELASIIGNYLETKGIEFSFVGFYRWILKVIAGKAGETMDDMEAGGIIKPKGRHAVRDAKTGRYVKRK